MSVSDSAPEFIPDPMESPVLDRIEGPGLRRIDLPKKEEKVRGRSRKPTLTELKSRLEEAREFSWRHQFADGHWCAELESNVTITAEYVMMKQALGHDLTSRRDAIRRHFFSEQHADGSWGIAARNLPGDISTTAETYLALRILGVEESDPRLKMAEGFILAHGGLEKMRIFTRINFAMFGLFPWDAVPSIPPEFIFLPKESPVNIYSLSSWARATMVPLFIIFHHRPCFALPNGRSTRNNWLDHLWQNPIHKKIPYMEPTLDVLKKNRLSWRSVFALSDQVLKAYDSFKAPMLSGTVRVAAVRRCEQWMLEHQEHSGDWAGIFPPMVNGVIALHLNGHSPKSEPLKKGLEAIERFAVEDEGGFRIQACVSPVWDTTLTMIGMVDSGLSGSDPRLVKAKDWLVDHQILVSYGDWKVYNPDGPPGGWAFEYENTWYPDVDDTAAVVLGLIKQDPSSKKGDCVRKAIDWMVSMQNRDGGFAAFDVENNKVFLNEIPFSDMDSLCDESCPDVTGRVIEALGYMRDDEASDRRTRWEDRRRQARIQKAAERGIQYLRKTQEIEGSWFGRWGVNYVYGTSNALCGLASQKIYPTDPMVERALAWLKQVQNEDGGWGEGLESYRDKTKMGVGPSSASQTAWALMGLLAYLPAQDPAIERGVRWLLSHQKGGTWQESEFTGTGFPNHFYLRYHFYRHYFPMMALGRYASALVE